MVKNVTGTVDSQDRDEFVSSAAYVQVEIGCDAHGGIFVQTEHRDLMFGLFRWHTDR
jgi:hypothetical protein